uniref:Probable serine/threonine-protein kinase mps1 n=1 Tax=Dermatophagoides pteronyssinus TaxID=6956 RepID=A0A6P6XWN1_DERPT|nr:probable serine/threonine-protein kinase mps1 [Dermatophagoides pteronyssinus]
MDQSFNNNNHDDNTDDSIDINDQQQQQHTNDLLARQKRFRITEKQLTYLTHKIEKLLVKLESEYETELATTPDEECVICISAKATMQTFPCGHRVVCRKCFVKTIQMVVSQRILPLRCVICRAKVLRLKQTTTGGFCCGSFGFNRSNLSNLSSTSSSNNGNNNNSKIDLNLIHWITGGGQSEQHSQIPIPTTTKLTTIKQPINIIDKHELRQQPIKIHKRPNSLSLQTPQTSTSSSSSSSLLRLQQTKSSPTTPTSCLTEIFNVQKALYDDWENDNNNNNQEAIIALPPIGSTSSDRIQIDDDDNDDDRQTFTQKIPYNNDTNNLVINTKNHQSDIVLTTTDTKNHHHSINQRPQVLDLESGIEWHERRLQRLLLRQQQQQQKQQSSPNYHYEQNSYRWKKQSLPISASFPFSTISAIDSMCGSSNRLSKTNQKQSKIEANFIGQRKLQYQQRSKSTLERPSAKSSLLSSSSPLLSSQQPSSSTTTTSILH